jgi:hypothetical protein
VLPATNAVVDRYFGPVHRSSFTALHRIDGAGWVQAAVWHFKTGKGGARRTHQTVFAYAINVYPSKKRAQAAVANVKIKTKPYRVSKIYSRIYRSSDGRETLVFLFFSYRGIEVESYYEYHGTAPARIAKSLRQAFHRQSVHLAAVARQLHRSILRETPTEIPTAGNTETPTPAATDTETPVPATAAPTAIPPTPRPLPSPTPTETPVPVLTVTAAATSPSYPPGSSATVNARVLLGSEPVAGAQVNMTFEFMGSPSFCSAVTNDAGNASCTQTVPEGTPNNFSVDVYVSAQAPGGGNAQTTVTFLVKQ